MQQSLGTTGSNQGFQIWLHRKFTWGVSQNSFLPDPHLNSVKSETIGLRPRQWHGPFLNLPNPDGVNSQPGGETPGYYSLSLKNMT